MQSNESPFLLEYRKGWAYLTVYPDAILYLEEVVHRMKLLGIPQVRHKRLHEIIDAASGHPEALVEWPGGAKLAAAYQVSLSEDRMRAWLTVKPPKKGGAVPRKEDLITALAEEDVTAGLDDTLLERIVRDQLFGMKHQVAKGNQPRAYQPPQVKYYFNTNPGKPYLMMDGGRINLKELNFIQNRKAGDLLAEEIPPVEGKTGITVTGEILPPPPAPGEEFLKGGQNTRLEGGKLYALIDGNVRKSGGKVLVEPVVIVDNVDYTTGNIHFDGAVEVKGTIAPEFTLSAGGTIQIRRYLGKTRITGEGEILLSAGINGSGEGVIRSQGDLYVRYIENATVHCGGNLFVEEGIMNSRVTVEGNLHLSGKRGEIIGGKITTGGSLWCKKLGSPGGVKTVLILGVSPGLLEKQKKINHLIETREKELNHTDDQVRKVEKLMTSAPGKVKKLEALYPGLMKKAARLEEEIRKLQSLQEEIAEKLQNSAEPVVVIEEEAFEGVSLTFGAEEKIIPSGGVRRTIFRYTRGVLQEKGFNPKEPPIFPYEEK